MTFHSLLFPKQGETRSIHMRQMQDCGPAGAPGTGNPGCLDGGCPAGCRW